MKYKVIIGAEIHVELSTKSKMFCSCKNEPFEAKKPNIHTCPVCLGLPGALPVPNKKAIEDTIKLGLALNCQIAEKSKFDRKHYFYPDLPKGYQISQYDQPFCTKGYLETSKGKVRINRIHLEEDAAKLIHKTINGKDLSLVDFNRSSVPLVEIVTEPDLKSTQQAKEFLKNIRKIVRYLEISDADMEKGSMRLEANVSLSKDGKLPDYKVEVKNINSFRFFVKAVEYEVQRQTKLLDQEKTPKQETRGWRTDLGKTVSQRSKEEAQDYRYFPEPDIPPLKISKKQIEKIKKDMKKTPEEFKQELIAQGISSKRAQKLIRSKKLAEYALKALKKDSGKYAEKIAKLIINHKIDLEKINPGDLIPHLEKQASSQISDQEKLSSIVTKVIQKNPNAVSDYKEGKKASIGFLMGKVMQETQGKADPQLARKILQQNLP